MRFRLRSLFVFVSLCAVAFAILIEIIACAREASIDSYLMRHGAMALAEEGHPFPSRIVAISFKGSKINGDEMQCLNELRYLRYLLLFDGQANTKFIRHLPHVFAIRWHDAMISDDEADLIIQKMPCQQIEFYNCNLTNRSDARLKRAFGSSFISDSDTRNLISEN